MIEVKRPAVLITAILLCFLAGCYEHETSGNESIYRFAWWLGPVILVSGILTTLIGWCFRRRKWGLAALIVGPLYVLLMTPAMYNDYVLIDDDHFEQRSGLWMSPTVHNVRFDELQEIRYVVDTDARGRRQDELRCMTTAGTLVVVNVGNLVKKIVPEIFARAKAKGVRVVIPSR
jgi:hypothetical protein